MRVAVVTGGNQGIGKEVCFQLAELRYRTIMTSRNIERAEATAKELAKENIEILPFELDVNSIESVKGIERFILGEFGRIDVLVNNAGIYLDNQIDGKFPSLFDMGIDILKMTFDTNLYGALRLIKVFALHMMKANYGRIVNVSSGMGRLTSMYPRGPEDRSRDPRSAPYYRMSKTALNVLTRIVASEVVEYNILVNSVCPGWVKTGMGGCDADRTLIEGAKGIIWAATLPDNGPSGEFFRDGRNLDW